jgi:hypothetical protein
MNWAATLWAEFDDAEALLGAVPPLEAHGCRIIDALTPYPLLELEDALRLRRPTLLLALVLGAAGLGGTLAYLLIRWTAVVSYPLDVGGRPLDSFVADIPILFESAVLAAALTAFAGVLFFSGLPRLAHPLDGIVGIEQASVDRFWLGLEVGRGTQIELLRELLNGLGARSVQRPSGPAPDGDGP